MLAADWVADVTDVADAGSGYWQRMLARDGRQQLTYAVSHKMTLLTLPTPYTLQAIPYALTMAKDIYHDTVKTALIKDGWTITDDPLTLAVGERNVYVDLGSEKLFAAEKEQQRIAIEVKSFIRPSPVQDLETALGQYVLYRGLLEESDVHRDRRLYLAVRDRIYFVFFKKK